MARLPGNVILTAFVDFPNEAAIIGRLLAGYSDLELALLNCIAHVRNDFDTALKVLFRTRGETQRIDTGDALGRRYYEALNLGTEFAMAISAMRYCLRIRNQYAHCVWWNDRSGSLAFANLEESAQENGPVNNLQSLTTRYVDASLLTEQEAYFKYADDLMAWVNYEGRVRAGKLTSQPLPKPPAMKQPPLHIP